MSPRHTGREMTPGLDVIRDMKGGVTFRERGTKVMEIMLMLETR